MDSIEVSGKSYLYIAGRGNDLFEYEASSDSFRKTREVDIYAGDFGRWCRLYEEDNTLKAMVHVNRNPTIVVYHYNEEHDQLVKIVSPSGIPTNDGAASEAHELISLSSGNYVLWNTTASPYLKLYKVTDDEWIELDSPSGLPNNMRYYTKAIGYDNKIFLAAAQNESYLSVTPGHYCYDPAVSSWSPVNTVSSIVQGDDFSSLSLISRVGTEFFVHENELYRVNQGNSNKLGAVVSKYNSDLSGFVEDHLINTPLPESRFGHSAIIDGKPIYYNLYNNLYAPNKTSCVYEGNGVWTIYKVFKASSDKTNRPFVFKTANGHCLLHGGQNFHGITRMDFSEFAGQHLWEKTKYPHDRNGNSPIAYGIALQDGSKGDIIKIRRIRR